MEYRRRIIDSDLDLLMDGLPAIAIEGARGVGKTETALRRARTVHRLDQSAARAALAADPARLLEGPTPRLIDEWQYLPESWDRVRRAVDEGAEPGSFLLTGSSSGVGTGTHSGAGRIVGARMRPMALAERLPSGSATVSLSGLLEGGGGPIHGSTSVRLADYVEEIVASGLPGIRPLSPRLRRAQLDGYVQRIIDRDFEELGRNLRRPDALRRWMTAYAAASSTTASFEKIRDAATGGEGDKPARSDVIPYRDILQRLFILDPVPAWMPVVTHLAGLGQAEKHQLADPALAANLLGLGPDALLRGEMLGQLFESLVTLSVRVYAQAAGARLGHMRTHRGTHEVDLIVERADGSVIGIEVKLSASEGDAYPHLLWLKEKLGERMLDALVITTGPDAYRRRDGIAVVPAALLGP